MRIVITGAGGQLGTALQAVLGDHEVIPYNRQQLDVTKLEAVRKAIQRVSPHLVINAAAYTNVDGAEAEQDQAFRTNSLGPRNLALASAAHHIPIVHLSTDYVFDGRQSRPYHEFDVPAPLSVYGHSKLAGEHHVRWSNPKHFIVRTAWLYHSVGKNFPKTICELAKQGEVRVVTDQYGSPTFAPHLAQGIGRLLETEAFGTYHLAGSGGTSWFEFTQVLFKHLGLHARVLPVSSSVFRRAARRPPYAVLTTLQDPQILLPPWEQGVQDFAALVRHRTRES